MRRNAQCQRAAGGKAAGADVSAAVHRDHPAIACIGHLIGFGDAVLHAEGIKREPHIAAAIPHQLAHHRQIAPLRANDHAAAEKKRIARLEGMGFSLTIRHGKPFTVSIS